MPVAPAALTIRLARPVELLALPAIERANASLFAPWGLDELFASAVTPPDVLVEALERGDLFVATCSSPEEGDQVMPRPARREERASSKPVTDERRGRRDETGSLIAGFAMLSRVDWHAHLDELHVHPEHGRKGIGSSLLQHTLEIARARELGRMTLVTMRQVPFNAPWYIRCGFRELTSAEIGPGLRTVLRREHLGGFPLEDRVLLAKDLPAADYNETR